MGYTKRKCDYCGKEYMADNRNLKRGWGLCCSKSCAANKREKSKPNYNPERVAANNIKRSNYKAEAYERGANAFARKRGFPDYESMQEDQMLDDISWDSHGGVEIDICECCNLRADYCRCGEGLDMVDW